MTELRNKYFPKELNRLEAHLTLFHALPGSKLESEIIPHIQNVAGKTKQFGVHAVSPQPLGKKGIAILIPGTEGGETARDIHLELKRPWSWWI